MIPTQLATDGRVAFCPASRISRRVQKKFFRQNEPTVLRNFNGNSVLQATTGEEQSQQSQTPALLWSSRAGKSPKRNTQIEPDTTKWAILKRTTPSSCIPPPPG
jgi:hypothetical protein